MKTPRIIAAARIARLAHARCPGWRAGLVVGVLLLVGWAAAASEPFVPRTPREKYNAGTAKLAKGDLGGAEALLFSAVAANEATVQATALYNLGLVRFEQGKDELKKSQDARTVTRRSQAAGASADAVLQQGFDALARAELNGLLAAYQRGRGIRKELKAATKAVQDAVERHGVALARWQRAAGDFHSVVELQGGAGAAPDAAHNADVTDRHIARLIDSLLQLQNMAQSLGDKQKQLAQLLKQIKGMLLEDMPGKAPGEEEEEEEADKPREPEAGREEQRPEGAEQAPLSPEAAARLLEAFQLDRNRPLPMGLDNTGQPKDRNRRNW